MPEKGDGPQTSGGISITCTWYGHMSQSITGTSPQRRDPSLYPSLSRKSEKRESFNNIKGSLGKFLISSPFRIAVGPSVCSMQEGKVSGRAGSTTETWELYSLLKFAYTYSTHTY